MRRGTDDAVLAAGLFAAFRGPDGPATIVAAAALAVVVLAEMVGRRRRRRRR